MKSKLLDYSFSEYLFLWRGYQEYILLYYADQFFFMILIGKRFQIKLMEICKKKKKGMDNLKN